MIKSIQELIEMKQGIEAKKNEVKTMYIPSLDTEVKFKLATRPEVVQVQSMDKVDIDPYLVYSHVIEPNLGDKQLQDVYNSSCEPFKIIDKLFTMEEVGELSLAIIGHNKKDLLKDIKN